MPKKIFVLLLLLLLLCSGCAPPAGDAGPDGGGAGEVCLQKKNSPPPGEYRAVWLSYSELSMKSQGGGTAESFRKKISGMFDRVKEFGLNTVIFHVRPFSDSFYPSGLFPWSAYLSGTQGKDVGYDPLAIALEEAQDRGLALEAWLNPYRVSFQSGFDGLSEDNPAKRWYKENPDTPDLIRTGGGIFYNPSSKRAQKLILDGAREILKNYAVSAIHLDDYFYPTDDVSIDREPYASYLSAGGSLSLGDWRRENVNALMSGLHAAVRSLRPEARLVVSPAGDIDKNRDKLYADVKKWCGEDGYADLIVPQLYYGFENGSKPFCVTADRWESLVTAPTVKFCFGMAFYKCGRPDRYAGSGAGEWTQRGDICGRQLRYMRGKENYSGFAVFSYSSLFSGNKLNFAEKEYKALKSMLK